MRVSVCSSVLNHSDFLRPMIKSVIDQSLKDWELILVDDGSEENIKSICEEFNDSRIIYIRFPENKGVPHGINYAISMASGDYIQLLSADERLEANKFLWQVGYLDDHENIGGIWGLPQNGEPGQRPEWEQYSLKAHNRSKEAWIRTLLNLESIPIGGASWLVRRSVLNDIGSFDPKFYTCSDLELFVRFFEKNEGRIFPYRWAWCEENPKALHKNVSADDFRRDIAAVRSAHQLITPPVEGRVTVAIPVKNMEKYLPQTLESMEGQTFKNLDIKIFDDGSDVPIPNASWRIEESAGPIAAQNHMLANCDTEFFTVLAGDDTVDPSFFEKCLARFKEDPWLEMVSSQTDFIDEEGKPYDKEHPFKTIARPSNKPRDQWMYQLYYGNQYFGASVYRTKALKEVGGWDSEVGVIADYELYLKLLQRENIYVIEENLTHTRIREDNRSILKTRQQQLDLRNHYHICHEKYWPPRKKVIIATPFYMMQGFVPYISSLVSTVATLIKCGIEAEFWELSGDSYIDRAKNTLMNRFLEDPDATDLFMIDADMQWHPEAFIKMLMLNEDIVMGSYPQKNGWDKWTSVPEMQTGDDGKPHPIGRLLSDGSAVIKAAYLSGGFIRIKKSAAEKYRDHYKDLTYMDQGADPSAPDRVYTEFFTCERDVLSEGGPVMRWGEDRVFGKRMKAIGVEGWIFPNVDIAHYGIKGWHGNYDKYLRHGTLAQ